MTSARFESFLQRVYRTTDIASQTELAAVLQINRSAVTQARKKDTVPARWILQLFRIFGLNPIWLENGVGEPYMKPSSTEETEFKHIPKVRARLSAGGGSFEVGSEIEQYYAFRNDWLRTKGSPERMVLMDIFGNSMEPELKDGDAVLIDESQKEIIAGAIFAVGVEETILVKRIEKHPSKLVLRSDNKDYAPIFLEGSDCESVRIIGKVVWAGREFN